jgi:hypothetical protein
VVLVLNQTARENALFPAHLETVVVMNSCSLEPTNATESGSESLAGFGVPTFFLLAVTVSEIEPVFGH